MADERAFTYHGGALEVARRLAPSAPEALDRPLDRASIHTPIPSPILSSKRGRGCPKGARSRSSRPPPRSVTARPLQASSRARLAGAHPSALSHIAAWGGRRVGADLQRFCIRLRRGRRWRRRGEAARGIGRARRRDRGQSQQSGWANHRRAPPSSIFMRASRGAEAC